MNEAELLFTDVLNCGRQELYLNPAAALDKAQGRSIAGALRRRMQGEPLQYILGHTGFMGLEFSVSQDVFIPRPETEILVEAVIETVRRFAGSKVRGLRILDLCTGSGCIAVSLAKLMPDVEITATDISRKALDIARENARLHKVEDKITFLQGDLFKPLAISHKPSAISHMPYAVCACNPPYVAAAQISGLQPEIGYEPKIALDGGVDGLDFYRRIIGASADHLQRGGFLVMEMGLGQFPRIKEIFSNSGKFGIIEAVRDYGRVDRVVVAQRV